MKNKYKITKVYIDDKNEEGLYVNGELQFEAPKISVGDILCFCVRELSPFILTEYQEIKIRKNNPFSQLPQKYSDLDNEESYDK